MAVYQDIAQGLSTYVAGLAQGEQSEEQGYAAFRGIRDIIDEHIGTCQSVEELGQLFDSRLSLTPAVQGVKLFQESYAPLMASGEAANTFFYLVGSAFKRMGELGEEGKRQQRELATSGILSQGKGYYSLGQTEGSFIPLYFLALEALREERDPTPPAAKSLLQKLRGMFPI